MDFGEGKRVVEDEDRISVEYPWLEFRKILRVRDLRRFAVLYQRLQTGSRGRV
jgi:hypothetical protein